jgi:hypothetical protein
MSQWLDIDNTSTIVAQIEWDGAAPFPPPPIGHTRVQFTGPAGVGWHWDGAKPVDPRPIPVPPAFGIAITQLANDLGVTGTKLTAQLQKMLVLP